MSIFSTESLYEAYRKAKADLFFERSVPSARQFAEYEDKLQNNIASLLRRLNEEKGKKWFKDNNFIGGVSFVPKSLKHQPNPETPIQQEPTFFASNAADNWDRIFRNVDARKETLEVELRPMAAFTVNMHVVCALWINMIGCKLDACLDNVAMGSRLRRVKGKQEYHTSVWQSFEPYIRSYKKWRDDGFSIVRREVNEGRKVVAVTMDFRRFFHKIDPNFLMDPSFLTLVNKKSKGACNFTPDEMEFTKNLIRGFETWSKKVPGFDATLPIGVPVGATASRVIANVMLLEFDDLIQRQLSPLYYARYVDDIFLVLHDTGTFACGGDVLNWLQERMGKTLAIKETPSGSCLAVNLSYGKNSELLFQTQKQRIFLIDNADLLDAIKSKVDEVSSEWRLLPDLKQLGTSAAAKVLSTSRDGTSDSDSLRKADTLLLKRLGFAILLRNADALVDAIPPHEWKKERKDMYEFALRHVFAPDKLFELFDYLPRLLGLAVSCRDWSYVHRILDETFKAQIGVRNRAEMKLDDKAMLGEEKDQIWEKQVWHLRSAFRESLLKSLPRLRSANEEKRCKGIYARLVDFPISVTELFEDEMVLLGKKMFCRDLARRPYKSFLLQEVWSDPNCASEVPDNLEGYLGERSREIAELLGNCAPKGASVMPVLFPTRPLSAADVSMLRPNEGADLEFLKRTLNTVRGTRYSVNPVDGKNIEATEAPGEALSSRRKRAATLKVGKGRRKEKPRLAITSFLTEVQSWCCAAGGKPDCSAARFQRLADLCNAIITTDVKVRPHYVLFPELSIPTRWMRTVAEALLRAGISIIAGEEYRHHGNRNKFVDSPARLYLTDNRLGYKTWAFLTQLKGSPAHRERNDLRRQFGLALRPSDVSLSKKNVFDHFGFRFGILICSELTDMKFRLKFRGAIDSLFVLSWNQDLETFAALVDATALDVHCSVALVNNRAYGDSRVRIPYKDPWLRDSVRVKGGMSDYFVVTDLDLAALRDFQSHFEPPEGPFKPFPDGFRILKPRRVIPGSKKD